MILRKYYIWEWEILISMQREKHLERVFMDQRVILGTLFVKYVGEFENGAKSKRKE